MADNGPIYAYKETRLNLDATTPGSTVAIHIPAPGASTAWGRKSEKRSHITEPPVAKDEHAFKKTQLATAASIYYRQYHKSPRSFLWRILEDEKVLSIRAVDVSKQTNASDSNITLRLTFPSAIVPGCVSFSDSKEHDVLNVFVVTDTKHLYTLALRPDFFRKPSSTEDNVRDWCKVSVITSFTTARPHRLFCLNANELLASSPNGELQKLSRKSADGSDWTATHYNDRSFRQNIRSWISLTGHNTIKYEGQTMYLSTPTSIASPSAGIDGIPYAFTVSLDHQLRVWNLQTGRIAYMGDILNHEPEANDSMKLVIDPSHSQLVKVYSDDENTLCVTYSPLGSGQFKFWDVQPAEEGQLEVIDLFPGDVLVPRTPTSDLWTLADFSVVLRRTSFDIFKLWILWKNNTTYRVQNLEFRRDSDENVQEAWKQEWAATATESLREVPLPSSFQGDPSDGTDKWLEFILAPGRFTAATIETGLAIYEGGLGGSKNSAHRSGILAERMCSIVGSTASLNHTSDGNMDFEQFRAATASQWRRFYRLLTELDKQRGEALSLVIDPQGEMPWVVLADGITAVRDCSHLETIWHNPENPPSGTEYLSNLVIGAAALRESLSDQFQHSCTAAVLGELFEEPSLIDPARMRAFYEKCDFTHQIGDEEYNQLLSNLGGGFQNVTPQVYEALLELMSASDEIDKRPHVLPLAEFGNKLIVKGVQEIAELHRSVCIDQLVLIVLLEVEVNHTEEGIQFETAAVFRRLLLMLQRLELINWLSKTQISLPLARERSNSITDKANLAKPTSNTETITVLEGVLRHLFGLDTRRDESMSSALTEVIIQICAPDSEYEAPPAVTQCFLLKNSRPDLALEFSRFAASDAFSTYIQGRACLASGDASTAATLFKKAAYGIANPDPGKRMDYRSAGFLDGTERNLLNAGMPQYYSHIVALFDKEKNYSYVIDFARLALQFIKTGSSDIQINQLRTEMHSRLFNAAVHTSRYELAHSILALLTDSALQLSSLRTLVTKMSENSYASQLINLPFIGLQDSVDEILAQKCQSIVEVNVGIPYHKILYAWRIKRSDFRGAASVSLERLQRLQQSGDGDIALGEDILDTAVTRQYIALINALSCVEPKQAWILAEEPPRKQTTGVKAVQSKRKVVTLQDVRKAYQQELDRIAAIENNQFAFAGGDEMEF